MWEIDAVDITQSAPLPQFCWLERKEGVPLFEPRAEYIAMRPRVELIVGANTARE
jgi:hypothetical protein